MGLTGYELYHVNLPLKGIMNANYKNEILKRKFYDYLKRAKHFSDDTIRSYEKSILLFEEFTSNDDFSNFNEEIVSGFVDWLKNRKKKKAYGIISLGYCYDRFRFLKGFFSWLSKQPGYRKKINETLIEYFALSKKETEVARQVKNVDCPTEDEVRKVIEGIKTDTEVGMRDKALFSIAFLTGARITAIRTLPMESFDENRQVIFQDEALGVKTKFSKRIITPLLPFSYKQTMGYFINWFNYLKDKKEFKSRDPIFPVTKMETGGEKLGFHNTQTVEMKFFKDSISLRKIFEKRFKEAGVKYYHPHTFRHNWVKKISKLYLTEEQRKALSQCLGHENAETTFGSGSYGRVSEERQIEIVEGIDFTGENNFEDNRIEKIVKKVMELSEKKSTEQDKN